MLSYQSIIAYCTLFSIWIYNFTSYVVCTKYLLNSTKYFIKLKVYCTSILKQSQNNTSKQTEGPVRKIEMLSQLGTSVNDEASA